MKEVAIQVSLHECCTIEIERDFSAKLSFGYSGRIFSTTNPIIFDLLMMKAVKRMSWKAQNTEIFEIVNECQNINW